MLMIMGIAQAETELSRHLISGTAHLGSPVTWLTSTKRNALLLLQGCHGGIRFSVISSGISLPRPLPSQ